MVRGLCPIPCIMGHPHGTLPIRCPPDLGTQVAVHSRLLWINLHDYIFCGRGKSSFLDCIYRIPCFQHNACKGCSSISNGCTCKSSRLLQASPHFIRPALTSLNLCSSDRQSSHSSRRSSNFWRWSGISSAIFPWAAQACALLLELVVVGLQPG